ncbi:MAG: flagellar filament capping protein FliD [Lachnospiraceae bacterium]|nr:flagellar filament capping protein FliD [Lachnospiraceae bacterium]
MGIGINVGSNSDYSYLFQGLSGSDSSGNLNFLSDYTAIKNGSYGKLMKSYYGTKNSSSITASGSKSSTSNVVDRILEEKKNPTVSKEAQEANSKLTSGISSLMTSVSTLQNDNTYKNSKDGTSAADKVVSAIKDYVSQYNDVVSAAKNSTLANATSHVAGMMNSSKANAEKLAEIGITINGDGTLQLNESKLASTDISKIQKLFSKDDVISYGSTVKSRLGFASASSSSVSSTEKDKAKEDEVTYGGAADLKKDIEKLLSNSLYEKIKGKDGKEQYDIDKLFAAVKNFVGNYNSMLDSAKASNNSGVIANLAQILEKTAQNKDALKQFGISVDNKGILKIDENTFRKSDMSQLQKFFGEYGSSIATHVSLVNYYMTTQANAASGYTANGTYNAQENFRYDVIM